MAIGELVTFLSFSGYSIEVDFVCSGGDKLPPISTGEGDTVCSRRFMIAFVTHRQEVIGRSRVEDGLTGLTISVIPCL